MSNKYFGGEVCDRGAAEEVDADLKAVVTGTAAKVEEKMAELRVADAITEIFTLFKRCNKYIDETMPWALAKDETKKDRLATVLYNLVDSIAIGASLLRPFMPETTDRILAQINAKERDYEELDVFGLYASGTHVTEKPEILFARLDVRDVMEKVEVLQAAQRALNGAEAEKETAEEDRKEALHVELKESVTIDTFDKLQFVVGEVADCQFVPKSKKLLCFQIRIGDQTKQILSGIRKWYPEPEKLIGKKVMALINLKPAKLAGMVSEGMLMSAEDAEGNVCLMAPSEDMPSGSSIG